MKTTGNYDAHAKYWNWGGIDETEKHEYWRKFAEKYGQNVLVPFCATGNCGAYLAEHGFNVTAFDLSEKMIEEGRKIHANVKNLSLFVGNIEDFNFEIDPVDFCFVSGDFGHIHTLDGIKNSLKSINRHMRMNGVMMISAEMPAKESVYIPMQTFYPPKDVYPGRKVWKTGDCTIDAVTKRRCFSQTMHIKYDDGREESFEHELYLQHYTKDEWFEAFGESGFYVKQCTMEEGWFMFTLEKRHLTGIIKSHDITLYGGCDHQIVLRPLTDFDIPLLIDLGSDMEVLKWADESADAPYTEQNIRGIWGSVSPNAWCFIIEVDGEPIGDCWLQKMNLPEVEAMYRDGMKICRIDASIGRKEYWNKGIGTEFMRMLIDFAFNGTDTELLYCMCDKLNIRSNRMLQKNGYTLVDQPLYEAENHYSLTRQEYIERRRYRPDESKIMMMPLSSLQPTQLYISDGKLRNVQEWFDPRDMGRFDPVPIKILNGVQIMTDGHTRAMAAHLAGLKSVPVYMDEDGLDMSAYSKDVEWCREDVIYSISDLEKRIVSHKDYELLWRKRCMEM